MSARIYQKPHVQTSQNFVAVARSSSETTMQKYVMYFRFCGWRHVFT